MDNPNPIVYAPEDRRLKRATIADPKVQEVFDIIRRIQDPEHPYTLEELNVVSEEQCTYKDDIVTVEFTPTVPHCSMSNLIGLMIITKLRRFLPPNVKTDVFVSKNAHL